MSIFMKTNLMEYNERLENENLTQRAEITKLRVENKVLRNLLEETKLNVEAAQRKIIEMKPQLEEALQHCKQLVLDADKLKHSFNTQQD
jgi:hypothetical protein